MKSLNKMQMQKTLTWSAFFDNAVKFIEISKKLGDSWKLVKKDSAEGNSYLVYEQKLKCKFDVSEDRNLENLIENVQYEDEAASSHCDEIIHLEYHVVYSISYQIPVLYFRGCRNDGSLISLEESWKIFTDNTVESNYSKSEMLSILTQMEHTVLFKPFLALHPCKTAEILANSLQSKNFIITFLSVMGPFIQLKLDNNYGVLN